MPTPPDRTMPGAAAGAARTGNSPAKSWALICLAAILLAYAAAIAAVRPAANFGSIQDDAIYFASAKAIANGRGYVLPSFPGGLSRIKYPELYPWLLSWIWRADPSFPANLTPAIALTVVFGWWFLIACYWLARETLSLEPGWALAVTAACAFNFFALVLGGSVMSDLPFAALGLTALLAADRSLEPRSNWAWALLAGALAGVSVGLRAVGITLIAGILVSAAIRRSWRRAGLVCLVSGALSLPWLLPVLLRALAGHGVTGQASQGWAQTLASYASYIGQWRQFVPTWSVQVDVVAKNLLNVFEDPGIFLLFPLASHNGLISVLAGSAVALGAWVGIVLGGIRGGWRAIHGAFLLYLAMILPLPFTVHRYLVAFLPFLLGGAAITARQAARWVNDSIRQPFPIARKLQGAAMGVILLALAVLAAANLAWAAPFQVASLMRSQRALLAQKMEAYRWIRRYTPADARFIAYDDVLLYLYTDRQAVRPIAMSPAAFYSGDLSYARNDAYHLANVARRIGATYWLVTPTDFGTELGSGRRILLAREDQLLHGFPTVFQSAGRAARIYKLSCLQSPRATGCPTLDN